MAELIGLTGKSGAGKTKTFQRLISVAQNAGLSVFGFYCPAIFNENEKVGMEVCLLPSGETKILGLLEKRENWIPVGRWWMDPSVFAVVNEHIRKYTGSDLLLIDEIGPAEIEEKKGWPDALALLREARFRMGVVSFRPAFIDYFKENYPEIIIIKLDEGGQSAFSSLLDRFCMPNLPA